MAEVEDGDKALVWLMENTADLALVDIAMPTISGEDVCRAIRAKRLGGHSLKVVAYTAHAMPDEVDKFVACGFDTVLCKPISRTSLMAMLVSLNLAPKESPQ